MNMKLNINTCEMNSGLSYTDEEKSLVGLMTGFFKSKILAVAVEEDFFSYLALRPRKFEEIQEYLKYPSRALKIFIEALMNMKLVVLNENQKYQTTGISSKYLAKNRLSYLGDVVDLFDSLYEDCAHLKNMLTHDSPHKKSYSYFFGKVDTENEISEYSEQMHRTSGSPAMALTEFCNFKKSNVVLDIGGGIGKTCMNLVSQFSHLKMKLFDLPAVCEKARTELEDFWLAHRIEVCEGDFFKDDFPKGYDTALMMRIAHDWSYDQLKYLFTKVYNDLPSGGKLIVYETFKNDDPADPGDAAMVSILLLIISPNGECRSRQEVKSLLEEIGFTSIRFVHTIYIYSAIIAVKP